MYNFFIDLIIWSFSIYGFLNFIDEFILDFFAYILRHLMNICTFFRKFIAKLSR